MGYKEMSRRIGSKNRAKILDVIPFDGVLCKDDIIGLTLLSDRTVHTHLKQLLDEGLIKKTKKISDMRKVFFRRIK